MQELSIFEISMRLVIAVVFSGVIGFDREFKNRPAGIRTHILVCVGATVIALIQKQIEAETFMAAINAPELAGILRSDPARLICQVVSGIGFLGAGTIIVTKRSVMGLTTAASLWAIAGLGLAIGMGYYLIATAGFVVIVAVLIVMKQVIHMPVLKRLEIQYSNPAQTREYIAGYFKDNAIEVKDVDYDVDFSRDKHAHTNIYTIGIPRQMDQANILEELAECKDISRIRAINI